MITPVGFEAAKHHTPGVVRGQTPQQVAVGSLDCDIVQPEERCVEVPRVRGDERRGAARDRCGTVDTVVVVGPRDGVDQ